MTVEPVSSYGSARWKKLRAEILASDPLCNDCNRQPSVTVHHIVRRSEGGPFFDRSNLLALCRGCHLARDRHFNRLNGALRWLKLPPPP
jgi:5-methylcytosine-specific restriction endonuclease McrA